MEKGAHTSEQRAHEGSTGYHVGKTPSHVGRHTASHVGWTPSQVHMVAGGRIQADKAKNNCYVDISRKLIISSL
jgi:hypothetical protein